MRWFAYGYNVMRRRPWFKLLAPGSFDIGRHPHTFY